MAYYNDKRRIRYSDNELFEQLWSPGNDIEQSGIYRCINCGLEIACNAGDRFVTQNKHQHTSRNPILWELVVATNSLHD